MSCSVRRLCNAVLSFAVIACFLVPYSVVASNEWLAVTGHARLSDGSYELVKTQAMNHAYQQAIELSQQKNKRAYLGESRIQEEYKENGHMIVKLNVEVKLRSVCEASQAQVYKKQVAVLGFSLQTPAQANMGQLADVERGFASQLGQSLKAQERLLVYEQSQVALHADVRNAPSHYTEQLTLTQAANFAKQSGVQFVVSGVIRDMSLEDSTAFASDYWSKLKRLSGQANQGRQFTVDVFIHDGFSGAIVWQQQFSISGQWQAELAARMAFNSPAFQRQDYGQKIAKLIDAISDDIVEQLRCQPFMTRVSRVEGKTLHFTSGASSGIRPGDTLAIYRTSNFYDANRLSGIDLHNVKTALTVSQVHPHFSSGTISVDPGRINIQEDDFLVAW